MLFSALRNQYFNPDRGYRMRHTLTLLVSLLTTLPAYAEITLDPAEVTAAASDCAQQVSTRCLFTLALHALATNTTSPENPNTISNIATAQARAGDIAGATRTLTFGPPRPEALLAMGQWDAAYALAQEGFANTIVEFGTAEGSFKIQMVQGQLLQNQPDLALRTAASITDQREHDMALQAIIDTLPPPGAIILTEQMHDVGGMFETEGARDRALLGISQTQTAQGDLWGASLTARKIADPNVRCKAMTALAAAQSSDLSGRTLAEAFLTSDQPRDRMSDGLRPVDCLLSISELYRQSGNTAQAATTARAAATYVESMRSHYTPSSHFAAQIRAATALALAGDTDGNRLLNLPLPPDLGPSERGQIAIGRYVAFTRLGDPRAAAELANYTALPHANPGDQGELKDAALELVRLGFFQQALDLTNVITATPYGSYEAYYVYMAIAEADPEVAITILPSIETGYMRTAVASSLARTFHANGDSPRARALLADNVSWSLAAVDAETPFADWKVSLLAELATAQAELGFREDAHATLQIAFVEAQTIERTHFRVSALLAIASALGN
jgi:hypothetical protein